MGEAMAATGAAETIIDKGPAWIEALGTLAPVVAIALLVVAVVALFVYAQRHDKKSTIETMEVLSNRFVDPITTAMNRNQKHQERILTNHFHDDQLSRDRMTEAFGGLTERIERGLDVLADKPGKG